MKNIKLFFQKFWIGVKNVFQKTTEITKVVIPVAVDVVEAVKKATDSGLLEFPLSLLKSAIKGPADDIVIDKVYGWMKSNLGYVIVSLNTIESIANIKDQNQRVIAILKYYQSATPNQQAQFYSGLAAQLAVDLSDGKLSLNEAFKLAKDFYIFNKK